MTRARRSRVLAVAIVAVLGVGVLGAFASSVLASSPPDLPPVSARALLASSLTALSRPVTVSGEVRTKIDLGLPDLPSSLAGAAGAGTANVLTSLIGSQDYKVWSSPEGVRIQHPMGFQEQDLVANKTQAWFWDSATNTATSLRTADLASSVGPRAGETPPMTPTAADVMGIARQILRSAGSCGTVSVSGTSSVAGRDAYDLTFTPSSQLTRVGSVTVAIDSRTRLPLEVLVVPRGANTTAVDIGFTRVSFAAIPASMFDFAPPTGAKVDDITSQVSSALAKGPQGAEPTPPPQKPVTMGTCMDVRVAVPLAKPLPAQVQSLLPYAGPLASAITVDHGGQTWLLVGLVDVSTLERDAASIP